MFFLSLSSLTKKNIDRKSPESSPGQNAMATLGFGHSGVQLLAMVDRGGFLAMGWDCLMVNRNPANPEMEKFLLNRGLAAQFQVVVW